MASTYESYNEDNSNISNDYDSNGNWYNDCDSINQLSTEASTGYHFFSLLLVGSEYLWEHGDFQEATLDLTKKSFNP